MQNTTQPGAIDLYRELVMLIDGEGVTSSRMVAARFGKTHAHALRKTSQVISDIKKIDPEMARSFFSEELYLDTYGRHQREVRMTRDGFTMLAMRFTGAKATKWQLQFIAAFKWMAGQLADRAENNRLMALFGIKDRKSIADGSYHGFGLQQRKVEKIDLKAEGNAIEAKIQASLLFDSAQPSATIN